MRTNKTGKAAGATDMATQAGRLYSLSVKLALMTDKPAPDVDETAEGVLRALERNGEDDEQPLCVFDFDALPGGDD